MPLALQDSDNRFYHSTKPILLSANSRHSQRSLVLTCFLADQLDRDAIFDSMRRRRYAALAPAFSGTEHLVRQGRTHRAKAVPDSASENYGSRLSRAGATSHDAFSRNQPGLRNVTGIGSIDRAHSNWSPPLSVSVSGKRDFARQRHRPRKRQSHSTARQQRQGAHTKTAPVRAYLHDVGKSLFPWDCVVGLGGLEPPTKRLSTASSVH